MLKNNSVDTETILRNAKQNTPLGTLNTAQEEMLPKFFTCC